MLSKTDVTRIWNECQTELKNQFPRYHRSIRQYNLAFGRKRRCYGTCKYGPKTIEIHMYLCKHVDTEEVRDTILHEMAHAIDKEVNGRSSGHGQPWKRIAREIGAKARSTSNKGGDVVKQSKYVMVLKKGSKLEYVCGKHRKSRTQPLNTTIKGMWLRSDKVGTMDKLMLISWNSFKEGYESGKISIKEMQMGV